MKIAAQKYEMVKVGKLRPHPKNPRRGDVGVIRESIAENGFYGAVIAQKGTGYILAGKHRLDAALAEGAETVPVIWLDIDDDRALKILAADNRTSDLAVYMDGGIDALLKDIMAGSGDLAGTGFQAADIVAAAAAMNAAAGVLDRAIQLRPAQEYVVIACETAEEFDAVKERLGLRMVRRGGYRPESQFDDHGIERVIPAARFLAS